VVVTGPLAGQTLGQILVEHRQWLIGDAADTESFPLLLKYLDCNRVLSVQVHPDDHFAATMDPPDRGKTEAWYIVDAEEDATIYAGLQSGVNRERLESAIRAGDVETVLHSFRPRRGDVVFIPAGTVHALGGGLLVAEIQQSSDTTFRLFDWNRLDAIGKPRQLHLQQGLEVTDYETGPVEPSHADPSRTGWQPLVTSDKFALSVLEQDSASLAGDRKFHVITVPRGRATLQHPDGADELSVGDSRLLPAAIGECEVSVAGDGTVLTAYLPGS